MQIDRKTACAAAGVLVLGVAMAAENLINVNVLPAQETRRLEKEATKMEQGKIRSILKNDHDDVDGLLLSSGVQVHFPPHMGDRITAVAWVGDSVQVEGRMEVTPRGDNVLEITRLVSGSHVIEIDRPKPPKHGPKGPRHERPMHAAGEVTDYARNPHGEVDGLMLKDGTEVKFPPHQSRELQEFVAVGDQVRIEGRRHVTPKGDIHLHADLVEADGQTIEREGPGHGPKNGPKAGPREREPQNGPTNADLLRELKAIRQLLEKQS